MEAFGIVHFFQKFLLSAASDTRNAEERQHLIGAVTALLGTYGADKKRYQQCNPDANKGGNGSDSSYLSAIKPHITRKAKKLNFEEIKQ